jgi:hypothetical protein
MNVGAWARRLSGQLPGWHVWYTSGGGMGRGWYAVPAPDGVDHADALKLPTGIGPYSTPQELRADAQDRYGWHDYCESCGVLARECGHRQPDREGARRAG